MKIKLTDKLNKMKLSIKNKGLISLIVVAGLLPATQALAVCPVCTIAVGAGLGLSRWMGISDAVTGLWIGGLLVSLSVWTLTWLDKKNIKFRFRAFVVTASYYLLTIFPLYYAKIIASPLNFICSCLKDKLLIGIITGSAAFYFGATLYDYLKEKNNGHAHFPFEKVVMPIAPLVILSIIFYFLTK